MSKFRAASFFPENAVRRNGRICGQMYECVGCGFPAVIVPRRYIYARGSRDYCLDERLERSLYPGNPVESSTIMGALEFMDLSAERNMNAPDGSELDIVKGEIVSFTNPKKWMSRIDFYEGFDPDCPHLYSRSLIPVEVEWTTELAWIYHFESEGDLLDTGIVVTRIKHGSWGRFVETGEH